MMGSEKDQEKIDEEADKSEKRLKYGAIAAGVGVVGGIVGNSLINGELGEKLKSAIDDGTVGKKTRSLLEKEATALDNLRNCLKTAGVTNTDNLSFTNFYPSVLSVNRLNCKKEFGALNGHSAIGMFADSTDATTVYNAMYNAGFTNATIAKMVGSSKSDATSIINKLSDSIESVQEKFKDAETKDKQSAADLGLVLGNVSGFDFGNGLSDVSSLFNGYYNNGYYSDSYYNNGSSYYNGSSFDLTSFISR